MKVGDMVKSGQGHTGIVTGIGYPGDCPTWRKLRFSSRSECPFQNPDIYVVTANGKRIWSYKALVVISESR